VVKENREMGRGRDRSVREGEKRGEGVCLILMEVNGLSLRRKTSVGETLGGKGRN